MILTFIIIIVVLLLWGNNRAKQKAERERIAYYERKHKRKQAYEAREQRDHRIWSVLFHISLCKEIYIDCDTRKATENYFKSSVKAVKEYQPNEEDIKVAIRFCKIHYANNKCDHFITPEEEERIYKIIELQKK